MLSPVLYLCQPWALCSKGCGFSVLSHLVSVYRGTQPGLAQILPTTNPGLPQQSQCSQTIA